MPLTQDQLGIAIDRLRPGAAYRRYDTYAALVETWEDETPVPTEQQLQDAYTAYDAEQQEIATLRNQIRTLAGSAVGVAFDQLTNVQIRALFAIVLYNMSGLDKTGKVRPLGEWVNLQ